MGIRVGIDLGTTFSVVAMIDEAAGKPVVIKNGYGKAITPSVLCFKSDGTILYGEEAKDMQLAGEEHTVSFFKRSMGKDSFSVPIHGKNYTATDFSAILLEKLKTEAERQAKAEIDAAVITVPSYFAEKERQATIEAGKRAGLNVLAIINEPTAAALAYGLTDKADEQTVLIYDLGGGTFDVTVAQINRDEINIRGSDGNHELGGKDWDDSIARYLASEFKERYGADITEDAAMTASILVTAENVKKQLTARDSVTVPLNYKGVKGNVEITEELFENISEFLLGTTKDITERLLDDINLSWNNIDGVILVGGSTRMRMIGKYIKEMSGKEPLGGVNVDEAVALGAAIKANISEKGQSLLTLPGTSRNAGRLLIIRGAKKVRDVSAHTLGMIAESAGREKYINESIIRKNTPIPSSKTKTFNFNTRSSELEVYVLQGDERRPLDNSILYKYVVSNIERTNPSISEIDVSYHYTADGVIEVSAVQKATNRVLPVRSEPIPGDMRWTDGCPQDQAPVQEPPSVEVLLCVDVSGSMSGTPIREAKKAMKKFIDEMDNSYTRIGIIPFADKADCTVKPTDNFGSAKQAVDGIWDADVGRCNDAEPFTTAYSVLRGGLLKKERQIRYIVVLTDGVWSYQDKAVKAAQKCHKAGIEVMAIGFGSADYSFLKKIASVDKFAALTGLSDLGHSFSKIAQAINTGAAGLSAG
ncbi:MAG: Hsp70 family protein [Treponema sp.]|jgi:molecular chaperone DnaK (HSP70)|nr:Hsp70 family protein [Treponema sp.]